MPLRTSAGGAKIGDFRFFVQMLAHTVTDKRADNAKALAFHVCLYGVTDVGDPVSLTCKFDTLVEALFCYRNELLCLL